ncbi:MAG: hypothetical protein KKH68_05910 [Proteobacteria bacterium]|nr:hypothetical protein [Pseudomonadota bacterium]
MENVKERVERRQHKRFEVRKGIFAAVTSGLNKLGPIRDISKGGLAFRYVNGAEQLSGCFDLDIFSKEIGFQVKKVPFEIVSDFGIDEDVPFSTIKTRQCGGRFGHLADSQLSQLDLFIRNCIKERRFTGDRRQFKFSGFHGPERRIGIERRKHLS